MSPNTARVMPAAPEIESGIEAAHNTILNLAEYAAQVALDNGLGTPLTVRFERMGLSHPETPPPPPAANVEPLDRLRVAMALTKLRGVLNGHRRSRPTLTALDAVAADLLAALGGEGLLMAPSDSPVGSRPEGALPAPAGARHATCDPAAGRSMSPEKAREAQP